jgi:hypothetical protein
MTQIVPPEWDSAHLTAAGTYKLASNPGTLHAVFVNQAATTVTIYDNTAASGTEIAVIGTETGPFIYDAALRKGLTVVIVGSSADITVEYAA